VTDLRQLMHEAVDQHRADHVGLAVRARSHGRVLRRRRRLSATVGTLAVLAGVVAAVSGGRGLFHGVEPASEAVAAPSGPFGADVVSAVPWGHRVGARPDGQQGSSYHRSRYPEAGQELALAIAGVSTATVFRIRGFRLTGPGSSRSSVQASLKLWPDDGSTPTVVEASSEPDSDFGGVARAEHYVTDCSHRPGCHSARLDDGSVMSTVIRQTVGARGPRSQLLMGMRYAAGSVVELEVFPPMSGSVLTGAPPVLSLDQLAEALTHLSLLP
jgi:hypothetical protein